MRCKIPYFADATMPKLYTSPTPSGGLPLFWPALRTLRPWFRDGFIHPSEIHLGGFTTCGSPTSFVKFVGTQDDPSLWWAVEENVAFVSSRPHPRPPFRL